MTIYCDMDGVVADFDTGYEIAFGVRPSKADDNVDWELVRKTPHFYRGLPLMEDALELWRYIRGHNPIFLSGVPWSVPEAPGNKREFLDFNFGPEVPAIFCPSKHKWTYCEPGDVLIDDWTKYQSSWINAGGVWVTHTSAADTIRQLAALGY